MGISFSSGWLYKKEQDYLHSHVHFILLNTIVQSDDFIQFNVKVISFIAIYVLGLRRKYSTQSVVVEFFISSRYRLLVDAIRCHICFGFAAETFDTIRGGKRVLDRGREISLKATKVTAHNFGADQSQRSDQLHNSTQNKP